jgi:hypothetical protein
MTAGAPSRCHSTLYYLQFNKLFAHTSRCALDDNVQKQQGKQISIDLFMNKKSLTMIACVRVDIMTASRRR